MTDQRQIRKILAEMAEKPDATSLLVDAEIRRIRSACITSSDEDCEDLITYATSIVDLRHQNAAKDAEISLLAAQNEWLKDRLSDLQLPRNSTKNIEEWLAECGMPNGGSDA